MDIVEVHTNLIRQVHRHFVDDTCQLEPCSLVIRRHVGLDAEHTVVSDIRILIRQLLGEWIKASSSVLKKVDRSR